MSEKEKSALVKKIQNIENKFRTGQEKLNNFLLSNTLLPIIFISLIVEASPSFIINSRLTRFRSNYMGIYVVNSFVYHYCSYALQILCYFFNSFCQQI